MNSGFCIRAATRLALVLATLFGAAAALAADEDWTRLDAISFGQHPDDRVRNVNVFFDGRMQRISFRARDNNVRCELIRIHYVNGGHQDVDHRRFPRDERRAFDLYGNDRRISFVHFNCRPGGDNRHARLVIYGR